MNNLKIFNTVEEYQAWKDVDDYVYPNICKVGDEVIYNNYPDPFWIEALEDVSAMYTHGTSTYAYYSYDKITWIRFTASVILRRGEKIYIKHKSDSSSSPYLEISGKYNVGGNILSLKKGSDYLIKSKINNVRNLFSFGATSVVSAKELILAAAGSNEAYRGFFKNCSLLIDAPKIPKSVVTECYKEMFENCTSLTKAPSLSILSSSGYGWYNSMFKGCTKLSYIKMMYDKDFNWSDTTAQWSRYWVSNVAPTGIFVASSKRTDFARGPHSIPVGWDLYLYDEDNDRYVVKFSVNGIPYEFYTDEPRDVKWSEFINSEQNTNGYYEEDNFHTIYASNGVDRILLNNEYVITSDKIILNASYTVGQRTATTELTEPTNVEE